MESIKVQVVTLKEIEIQIPKRYNFLLNANDPLNPIDRTLSWDEWKRAKSFKQYLEQQLAKTNEECEVLTYNIKK